MVATIYKFESVEDGMRWIRDRLQNLEHEAFQLDKEILDDAQTLVNEIDETFGHLHEDYCEIHCGYLHDLAGSLEGIYEQTHLWLLKQIRLVRKDSSDSVFARANAEPTANVSTAAEGGGFEVQRFTLSWADQVRILDHQIRNINDDYIDLERFILDIGHPCPDAFGYKGYITTEEDKERGAGRYSAEDI